MEGTTKVNAWSGLVTLVCVALAACATEPIYEHGALLDQLLRPRPGHVGNLTNQVCKERKGSVCVKWDLIDYDLRETPGRERLIAVKLICNVAGQRFRVCKDKPGLCSQTKQVTRRFLGIPVKRELVETAYIQAVEGYARLLDADTRCAAADSELGQRLFLQ